MNSTIVLLEMRKKKTMHILHLLLTLLTSGLWIPVWIIRAIINSSDNKDIDRKINAIMAADGVK
tara:strand:+ start:2347 stop:2538 length:192 start_codon:yes stop_codon:yes gene_type:complete